MAAYSVLVVEVAVVGQEAVAGKVPEVEPRKEVGSVAGYAGAAQQYSYSHYCYLCWASSGIQCSVAAGYDTVTAERQIDCVEGAGAGAGAGRRRP